MYECTSIKLLVSDAAFADHHQLGTQKLLCGDAFTDLTCELRFCFLLLQFYVEEPF